MGVIRALLAMHQIVSKAFLNLLSWKIVNFLLESYEYVKDLDIWIKKWKMSLRHSCLSDKVTPKADWFILS